MLRVYSKCIKGLIIGHVRGCVRRCSIDMLGRVLSVTSTVSGISSISLCQLMSVLKGCDRGITEGVLTC